LTTNRKDLSKERGAEYTPHLGKEHGRIWSIGEILKREGKENPAKDKPPQTLPGKSGK